MYVYVIMRRYRNDVWNRDELVEIRENKDSAECFVSHKNAMHPSNQPYEYRVIKKKLK